MHVNHPKINPPTPVRRKTLLQNQSLVPKSLRTNCAREVSGEQAVPQPISEALSSPAAP